MTKPVTFQFEDCFEPNSKLKYQKKAIMSVVDLFKGVSRDIGGVVNLNRRKTLKEGDPVRNPHIVSGSKLLANLNEIQLKNEIFLDSELKDNNFCVEMETGTGKTYVYLRTILELNKEYQFKKFIIVVPSVAIRKGVEKSITQLAEHFEALYDGLNILNHYFVFDSKVAVGTVAAKLIESNDLSIMITTSQSIAGDNKRLKGLSEEAKMIGEKVVVWDELKYIKPIIIVDEPQRVVGLKKKSKASEAIDEVNPLFSLHYSATPPKNKFNTVYRLDSFAAFNGELVKQIEVKTIYGQIPKDFRYIRFIDVTQDLRAKLEIFGSEQGSGRSKPIPVRLSGGGSLYQASGKLGQYKNVFVHENPHKLKPLKISIDGDIIELSKGEATWKPDTESVKRMQIKIAIRNHLDKQFDFLERGQRIKVLSLFFIDSVIKVRDEKALDGSGRGEYLRIFDEEYNKIINSEKYARLFEKYDDLFKKHKETNLVREGYFARDKSGAVVDIEDTTNENKPFEEVNFVKKTQEDIDRGIQLILDSKDKLIQFDEPLAFIFSHSALREGWDNPNVFTLCTLKSGGSEIAKKQEIGRGLRLALNDSGERIYDSEVNRLTVVVNDNYEHFAESVQKDFNEQAGFNKDEITFELLQKTLKQAGVKKITAELVDLFRVELIAGGIINGKNILQTKADIKTLKFSNEVLDTFSQNIAEKFTKLVTERGSTKIVIRNADLEPVVNEKQSYANEKDFKAIMDELFSRMKKRTYYSVKIDSEKFISNTADTLNDEYENAAIVNVFDVTEGKVKIDKSRKFEVSGGVTDKIREDSEEDLYKSDYEIVNFIMYHTNLPRLAIVKILQRFKRRDLLNSQDWLDRITYRVSELLTDVKAESISHYNVIEGYNYDEKIIFEADIIDNPEDLDDAKKRVLKTDTSKRKAIHKYYKMDGSGGEYDFARHLEANDKVLLWTKLKKGRFVIDTPYGDYTPDWAVVVKGEQKPQLYFVFETKIDKTWNDLMADEKAKIKCGIHHFKAIGGIDKFDWVDGFDSITQDNFKTKFGIR